jgi:ABC-type multidrug transport system fused ATPase/permease subunit
MSIPLRLLWDLLSHYIRPQKLRFWLLSTLLLGGIVLQVINPQIIRSFIDGALSGVQLRTLLFAALAFIGIAVLQQAMAVCVIYLGENVAWTATNLLREDLARHCVGLDLSFHNAHTPGELIERIDGDVAELASFFSRFVVTLIGNLLLLAGILIALFREDWWIGIAFLIFAGLTLYILNQVRDIAVPHQKARRQAEAELFGFLEEQLASTEDIRSSGAVGFSLRELYRLQAGILKHDRKSQLKSWYLELVMGGLLTIGSIMCIVTGYILFRGGAITIGTVYLLVVYMNLLEQPIWTLTEEIRGFQTIGASVERLVELRKIQPKLIDGTQELIVSEALCLTFKNVTFSYDSAEPVLLNLDFTLEAGKLLGLLGRTGSGKTTLARLVFRLYDPAAGSILLDHKDIRTYKLQSLRSRVAMVTQEVQIFQASLRDNLTFFNRSISDEQIMVGFAELGLMDWFQSLPDGLDTGLESGGRNLSAGEAQLLAFTRIFLRNPGLIILDEASSRLDPATESQIERAIDRLLRGRTAIIIAHRLGTIQRVDQIMILEAGRVQEFGERQRLAVNPKTRFHTLLQTGMEEVLA